MSEPSRKLSSEEVNALMDGLKSGDLSASTSVRDGMKLNIKNLILDRMTYRFLGDYYALKIN